MKRITSLSFFCLSLYFIGLLAGCSISHSISSSSDSSRSISRSSTSCSGPQVPEETRKAYVKDVTTYVSAVGKSGITSEDFMRGLGSIAKRHSISDWEDYKYTYIAIGKGLKAAGVERNRIMAFPIFQG